jgi:hypothetical protein
MKHSAEYRKFTNLVDHLMSVPHEEIKRREAEYKKQADANPNKRGPKPGTKKKKRKLVKQRSASGHEPSDIG